jgi:DNA repair exonuclease SbcCD ATPase subunit
VIVFKKISWKNLLSTGNSFTEVYLDRYSTILVSGNNGAGKSTILDALSFSLYGKSFRGINVSKLVNTVNDKDCLVEIEFTTNKHSYTVKRGLKPKVFEIYKDGKLVPQNATVKDYQSLLEDSILKMSYKAFCQVVILGSSNYIPFMKLPNKDRKTIVENLLDINIFSIMNSILKIRAMENRDKLTLVNNKIDVMKSKIDSHSNLIKRMEDKSKESVNNYKEEIDRTKSQLSSFSEEIEKHQKEISDLNDRISGKDSVFSKLSRAEKLESQIKHNVKKVEKEISFYKDNNSCPTCHQEITEEHKDLEISSKKEHLDELCGAVTSISDTIKDMEDRVGEINEISNKISNIEDTMKEIGSNISACNKYISKMNESIEEVSRDREDLDNERSNLSEMESEYEEFDTKRVELTEQRTDLENVSKLLRDTGIKSRIISYYLPIMNNMINKYLSDMNFFCQFTLDENFDETIKSRYRDDFTYHNFSEGERLRIDLSLLLAWREVARMKNSVNCNLLILDEVFDSSLDAVGTEEFFKILGSMGRKTNIFVITHKSDQLVDKFENNLHFVKKGNFSDVSFRMHKDED